MSTSDSRRFKHERRTIEAMIDIYCRDRHGSKKRQRCAACAEVLAYAAGRLDRCLFPDTKPTCATCPVHCYKPAMRTMVKEIMRYAGPRMAYRRPCLALRHYINGRASRRMALETRRSASAAPRPSAPAGSPDGGRTACPDPPAEGSSSGT